MSVYTLGIWTAARKHERPVPGADGALVTRQGRYGSATSNSPSGKSEWKPFRSWLRFSG